MTNATTRVEFETKWGKKASGDLAVPAGTGKAPAVVLIQEWWGVNDHIRSLITRLAEDGFLALAVDLYHGKVTKDPDEAGKLMAALDHERALEDIEAAATYLTAHERAGGRVGVIGFCMGGMLTFRAAERISDFSCAVPFYGVPPAEQYNVSKVRAPILILHGEGDQVIPYTSGKYLYTLANQPKTFHPLGDAGHEALSDPSTWAAEADFIHRLFPTP